MSLSLVGQNLEDGSIEERQYVDGAKTGCATIKHRNGDVFELNYEDNKYSGKAKLHFVANDVVEECHYVDGVKHGPSVEMKAGDRENRNYVDGQLQGDAAVFGTNGDKLEFKYKGT